jgi:hypothetical protein
MIPVPRAFQYSYQRCYKALCDQLAISPDNDFARLHADLVASLYVAYLEARADLTALTDARNGPGRTDSKNKEIRTQRRQMLVARKAYSAQMSRLTADLRRTPSLPVESGDALAAIANGNGLRRPPNPTKKPKA